MRLCQGVEINFVPWETFLIQSFDCKSFFYYGYNSLVYRAISMKFRVSVVNVLNNSHIIISLISISAN